MLHAGWSGGVDSFTDRDNDQHLAIMDAVLTRPRTSMASRMKMGAQNQTMTAMVSPTKPTHVLLNQKTSMASRTKMAVMKRTPTKIRTQMWKTRVH